LPRQIIDDDQGPEEKRMGDVAAYYPKQDVAAEVPLA